MTVADRHVPRQRRDDPVDRHIAALTTALHGPAHAKDRMLREAHDGLTDAAEALVAGGASEDRAARQAVREFGTVEDVRPAFQRELTLAQARQTARLVALTVPALLACWWLVDSLAGQGRDRPLPRGAEVLAAHLGGVAAASAVLAGAAFLATGSLARRLPTPPRLPLVVAWAATGASVALAVTAFALAAASVYTGDWILISLVGTLVLASHMRIASSARACRTCARLSHGTPTT